jgi:hypothetical protein
MVLPDQQFRGSSVSDRSLLLLSRRSLLLGTAGLVSGLTVRSAAAQTYSTCQATTAAKTKLYLVSGGGDGKEVATVKGGKSVRVLAGPDANGWYLVDTGDSASATPGWTPADNLIFTQRAKIAWDTGLFGGASDASGWLGSIRHNLVVTVAGPSTNGYTWVRYGALAGFTYDSALVATDEALTDPTAEWWVDANRSTLKVRLMVGQQVVDEFNCRMSTDTGDGFYSTATGTYWIYEKVEGLQYTPYAKAYFMYWGGFDPYRYNGFHSWTMDANGYLLPGGNGNTAGCIATQPADAKVIYNFLRIGTRTEIHW